MPRLAIGDHASAFSLTRHDGSELTSASLAGQRYVLYFYPADDTPGCTREACQFNDELAQFAALNVQVIGVSPDDQDSHQAFREKYGLRFDLVSDPSHTTMAAYGADGEKLNYGKTIIGVIRSTFVIGPDGTIEQAWYGVKTDGHAARVLKSLQR